MARPLKVTRGRKLRTAGTGVETPLPQPTHSPNPIAEQAAIGRLGQRAKGRVGDAVASGQNRFCDRTRSAKRPVHQIREALRRRGEQADRGRRAADRRLLAGHSATAAANVPAELARGVPVIEQVIDQTGRRGFEGQRVPAAQKLSASSSRLPGSAGGSRPASRPSLAAGSGATR